MNRSFDELLFNVRKRLRNKKDWDIKDEYYTALKCGNWREPYLTQMYNLNKYMYTTASNLEIHNIHKSVYTPDPESLILDAFIPSKLARKLWKKLEPDIWMITSDINGNLITGLKDKRYKDYFGENYTKMNTLKLTKFYKKDNPFDFHGLLSHLHSIIKSENDENYMNKIFFELTDKLEKSVINKDNICYVYFEDSIFGRQTMYARILKHLESI
jgi:hypothetical protein